MLGVGFEKYFEISRYFNLELLCQPLSQTFVTLLTLLNLVAAITAPSLCGKVTSNRLLERITFHLLKQFIFFNAPPNIWSLSKMVEETKRKILLQLAFDVIE